MTSSASFVDEQNRGRLLHFFANHELLAAELMALALLKFPDAPESFRRGLFRTLQEEQKHTLWYLGRMKECGVQLGEFSLSRFFWDTVAPMETPFDYVSRLSLTFEQANLDYSLHYGAILREAGDPRTAKIMERIYRDEIDHVGYGLKWFRRWKSPGESDWDAYDRSLRLPLSPSRAKGNGTAFNDAGRRESGLDEDFIRRLRVFERSKGRTPRVTCFNPDVEEELASPTPAHYRPGGAVRSLVVDLEILQIFLARRDDIALMRRPPSLDHLETLRRWGLPLPEIEPLLPDGSLPGDSGLYERKVRAIQPWSVSPGLGQRFGGLCPADCLWREGWENLFSKSEQVSALAAWADGAKVYSDPVEVEEACRRRGPIVMKRPLSAAGRGLGFPADPAEAAALAERWLQTDPALVVEPLHQRVLDFSVQLDANGASLHRLGQVRQLVDDRGRYRGSLHTPKFCRGLNPEVARFLMDQVLPRYEPGSPFLVDLGNWIAAHGYRGPVGIDAYLYRTEKGDLALRTCCEINPRTTMGRVALEMGRAVRPGFSLRFDIRKRTRVPAQLPLPSIDPKTGRLDGGTVILNEIGSATRFVATMTVDKDPCHL